MNLKVLQWLLKNKDVLLKIVEISKGFRKDAPYLEQWEIADKIARLLIPIIEPATARALRTWGPDEYVTLANHDIAMLAIGAEVQALGIDYKTLIEVILPIIIAILEVLVRK